MKELINTWPIEAPIGTPPTPMERDQFYLEQIEAYRKTGQPTKRLQGVGVFMFNANKQMFLGVRSETKNHNAGLIDKTIGGHIRSGETEEEAVQWETLEELEIPVLISSVDDWLTKLERIKPHLPKAALVRKIDTCDCELGKIFKTPTGSERIVIGNRTEVYMGIFSGPTRTADAEATGVLQYTIEQLQKMLAESPNRFTEDLVFFIDKYVSQFRELLDEKF